MRMILRRFNQRAICLNPESRGVMFRRYKMDLSFLDEGMLKLVLNRDNHGVKYINALSYRIKEWEAEKANQMASSFLGGSKTNERSIVVQFPTSEYLEIENASVKTLWDVYRLHFLPLHPESPQSIGFVTRSNEGRKLVFGMDTVLGKVASDDGRLVIEKWITFDDSRGKSIFWHSSAHILGAAIEMFYLKNWEVEGSDYLSGSSVDSLGKRMIPLLKAGSAVLDRTPGFHCDFHLNALFKGQNIRWLEDCIRVIIDGRYRFESLLMSKKTALRIFSYNPLKVASIEELSDDAQVRVCRCLGTPFVDICYDHHLPHTGLIQAFKLNQISSFKYQVKEGRDPILLQRISGISFPTQEMMDEYEEQQKLLKSTDHRVIGKIQKLFIFLDNSPGSTFFLPHGVHILNKLMQIVRDKCKAHDYKEVVTPTMFEEKIWKTSGHLDYYRQNMFFIHNEKKSGPTFGIKPMNCPGHCLIYNSDIRSYKDLPIRYSEFSALHRNEIKGALSGLTRVVKFHQDDAHIFCSVDQIEAELITIINMVDYFYKTVLKFRYEIQVSTRPKDSIGSDRDWKKAEMALISALKKKKMKYKINEGDGAFYGPKIDFSVKDVFARKHQCATIQIDFQLPQKFELKYTDASGNQKTPVMIHRAIFGSFERIYALLLENRKGHLPLWISPRQVSICPVSREHNEYARAIFEELKKSGYEVELMDEDVFLSKKIAVSRKMLFNYILVVGDDEIRNGNVVVRFRENNNMKKLNLEEFKTKLQKRIEMWE